MSMLLNNRQDRALPRTTKSSPTWLLSHSLEHLFQCLITLAVKKFSSLFKWNFLNFNLCPLPLALALGTTEKSLTASSLCPHITY